MRVFLVDIFEVMQSSLAVALIDIEAVEVELDCDAVLVEQVDEIAQHFLDPFSLLEGVVSPIDFKVDGVFL